MRPVRLEILPLLLGGLGALLGTGCPHGAGPAVHTPSALGNTHADREFSERVKKYVKLHKQMESSLPSLKVTKDPSNITEHQKALAKKIYEARRDAKQGDIFTPDVTAEFRERLSSEFHGPDATQARATIKQGEPLKAVSLEVNNTFPEGVPSTTVPPTLLQKLPPLPPEVEYRIVDRYLVLADVRANLVVDFIDGSIPGKSVK
jgi:hypothetical protein